MVDSDAQFGPLTPEPRSWAEVLLITAGQSEVPIEAIERGRLDWEYDFGSSDMRPCGRHGCRQEHGHGWVVALRDGTYVNVGNDCAHRYANAALWSAGVRSYRDRRDRAFRNQVLIEARSAAQERLHQLDNWPELHEVVALHRSFSAQAGGPVLAELVHRAERGLTKIERDVRLTDEELALRRAMAEGARAGSGPAPYVAPIERRTVGELAGLRCFHPAKTPANARASLHVLAETVVKWVPDQADPTDARNLSRATRDLVPRFNDLVESIRAAETFFAERNLASLMKLEVIRRQGIVSIQRTSPATIKLVRRDHWGKAA